MILPPIPPNEAERLAALRALGVLDTPPEERFDRLTRLATALFGVPIALVSLVDQDRQWFKSCVGLDARETPRAVSFCGHAVAAERPLVVPDATLDPRFADNPLVTGGPRIRFYASQPLVTAGQTIGSLCLIDSVPRMFSDAQLAQRRDLADIAEEELGKTAANSELYAATQKLDAVLQASPLAIITHDPHGRVASWNPAAERLFGWREAEAVGGLPPYLGPDAVEEFQHLTRRVVAGETLNGVEIVRRRKDGAAVELSLSAAALLDPQGRPVGVVRILADIGERQRHRRALEQAKQNLENQVRARTAELRIALARLSSHIENSPLALIEWDAESRVSYWSARAEEIFGWRAEQVLGRHPADWSFVHPEDAAAAGAAMDRLSSGAEPRNVIRLRNFDRAGAVLHCEWHNSALFDADGRLLTVLSLVKDGTAKARAETALRASENDFRGIFEQAAVGIAHVSLDGRCLRANRKMSELLGYSEAELQALSYAQITHPDDAPTDAELLRQLLAGEIPTYTLEKRYRRKDGSLLWASLTVSLHTGAEGRPPHFISIVQDVSARVRAEAAVRASEDLYRNTFEQAGVGIAHISLDERCLWANPAFCRLLGHSLEEVLALDYRAAALPENYQRDRANLRRMLAGRQDSYVTERPYRRKDGGLIWTHVTVTLRRDAAGAPVHFIVVMEDIQARKDAEAVLRQSLTELEWHVADRTESLAASNQALALEVSQRRAVEQTLRDSEARTRSILENSYDAFVGMDEAGAVTEWNREAERLFDRSRAEALGRQLSELIIPARYRDAHEAGLRRFLHAGDAKVINQRLELTALRADGSEFSVELTIGALQLDGGHFFSAFLHDISERKRLEQEREAGRELLNTVLETLDVGIVACDGQGRLTLFNRTSREFHGLPARAEVGPEQWAGQYDLYHADGETPLPAAEAPLYRALKGEVVRETEMAIVRPGAAPRFLSASGRAMRNARGEPLGAVVAMHDVTARKHAEQALRDSETRLRVMYERAPVGICEAGLDGRLRHVNPRFCEITGYAREELIGRTFQSITHPDDVAADVAAYARAAAGEQPSYRMEKRYVHKQGHVVWIDLTGSVVCDPDGAPAYGIGIVQDVTERRLAEQALREGEARLRTITDNLPVLIAYIDREQRYRFCNGHYEAVFGIKPEAFIGRTVREMLGEEAHAELAAPMARALAGERVRFERHGTERGLDSHFLVDYIPEVTTEGDVPGFYVLVLDITARKQLELALQHQATHDPFTGLPNRAALLTRLEHALAHARRNHQPLALLFLDLDGFKQVNDVHGHAAGDALLQAFAKRLLACVRASDTVARLAGDEFVVLLEEVHGLPEAEEVGCKIMTCLERPLSVAGGQLRPRASIGLAFSAAGEESPDALLQRADAAMYAVKRARPVASGARARAATADG